MLVDVTVGVPDPASVDVERVRRELPHGEVTVRAQTGGLRVPGFDTLIACVAITVSVDEPLPSRMLKGPICGEQRPGDLRASIMAASTRPTQ